MKLPSFELEKKYLYHNFCVGIDEAGRGPLAGPVVASAVWVSPDIFKKDFKERRLIRDSKTLSEKQRISICRYMKESGNFIIGTGEVSHYIIDKINILNATLLAMKMAVDELNGKLKTDSKTRLWTKTKAELCLLIDGNRRIPKTKYQQRLFAGGDAKVFSIAAASICAKVYRDNLMMRIHQKYPVYGFDRHKGYGTQFHMQALKKFGPCDIHRKSFAPVKDYIKSQG